MDSILVEKRITLSVQGWPTKIRLVQDLCADDTEKTDIGLICLQVDVLNSVERHVVQHLRAGTLRHMPEHLVVERDPLAPLDRPNLDLHPCGCRGLTGVRPAAIDAQRFVGREDVIRESGTFLSRHTMTLGALDKELLAKGANQRIVDLRLDRITVVEAAGVLEELGTLVDCEGDGLR